MQEKHVRHSSLFFSLFFRSYSAIRSSSSSFEAASIFLSNPTNLTNSGGEVSLSPLCSSLGFSSLIARQLAFFWRSLTRLLSYLWNEAPIRGYGAQRRSSAKREVILAL